MREQLYKKRNSNYNAGYSVFKCYCCKGGGAWESGADK